MNGRAPIGLLAVAALTLASCDGRAVRSGDAVPDAWRSPVEAEPERPVVYWAFRSEDCLRCSAGSVVLRDLHERYGDTVAYRALLIGEEAPYVREFLVRRRLGWVALRIIGSGTSARPRGPVPGFVIAFGDTVRALTRGTEETMEVLDSIRSRRHESPVRSANRSHNRPR